MIKGRRTRIRDKRRGEREGGRGKKDVEKIGERTGGDKEEGDRRGKGRRCGEGKRRRGEEGKERNSIWMRRKKKGTTRGGSNLVTRTLEGH